MTRLVDLVEDAMAAAATDRWAIAGPGEVEIHGIGFDSRFVKPGQLFFAVPGSRFDGHDFAAAAASSGAAAVVVDRLLSIDVPQVVVPDVRVAMAWIAAIYHGQPSRRLSVVGITGTNGKTTTAAIVRDILSASGRPCGLIGTLTGERTTPEAPDLQDRLARLVEDGLRAAAIEVSSHALDQSRAEGVWFEVGVFTNLSPDHLDYHGTLENYFEAKAALFTPERIRTAVINVADPWGRRLAEQVRVPVVAVEERRHRLTLDGSGFAWRGTEHETPLLGGFNVTNTVLAAEAAVAVGVDVGDVAAALAAIESVPGRFELVERGGGAPTVVVDYAHTPDGLEQVLTSVRQLTGPGKVVVVFGCGGARDKDKRPLMGSVATRLADAVVVTSDNPRSEDPATIIADVLSGVATRDHLIVEPDREAAIGIGIGLAGPGDAVVIAGKGHETTQTIGDEVLPFDDREVARRLLGEGTAR